MPISIAALAVNRETIQVQFPEGVLTLTYDPNKFNAEFEQKQKELKDDEASIRGFAVMLCDLIVSWDVVDNGKPVAVSADVLAQAGMGVLSAISRAIGEHQNPNSQTAASDNGSPPTGTSASARNGTR